MGAHVNDTIHDCLVSINGKKPNEELMKKVIRLLPSDILLIAEQWGQYDTEFRDKVYVWIQDNKQLLTWSGEKSYEI